jgi:hypothetical protein
MFPSRKSHQLFFDLGHRFGKLGHVEWDGRRHKLAKLFLHPTPDRCFKGGTIANPLLLKELIHLLLKPFPKDVIDKAKFTLIVPDTQTFIKHLVLPKHLPKDLYQHMKYEAQQYIPYPVQDAVVDYDPLPATSPLGGSVADNQTGFLLTVSKKSAVEPLVRLFQDLDLELDVVTPNCVGLLGLSTPLLPKNPDGFGIFQLGESSADLLYVSKSTLRLSHFPHGFLAVLNHTAIQCGLQVNETRYFAEEVHPREIPDVFSSHFHLHLTRWLEEIGDTFLNMIQTPERGTSTRSSSSGSGSGPIPVFVTGGVSRLPKLAACFARLPQLHIQPLASVLSPSWSHMTFSSQSVFDDMMTFAPSLVGTLLSP